LPWLRTAYLLAAVLLLTALPVSQSSVMLALFVAVDLAAAALFLSRPVAATSPAVHAIGNQASLPLLRRTIPELRSRRPAAIIELQVQWRQAAEFRRRRNFVMRRSAD
jgi:hypothetical protein